MNCVETCILNSCRYGQILYICDEFLKHNLPIAWDIKMSQILRRYLQINVANAYSIIYDMEDITQYLF